MFYFCLPVHSTLFSHYELSLQYNFGHKKNRPVLSIIDNVDSDENNLIILQWLFQERKAFTIHLTFSPSNKSFVKTFIDKLIIFSNEK